MATVGTLGAQQRRAMLQERLNHDGALRLDDIAEELSVSAMTVRRDLDDMEAEGLLRRVRGGAISIAGPRPFDERRAVRSRAKQVIASKAAALIPQSGSIALDASTTTGTIASTLGQREGLSVATNSLENFVVLRAIPGVTGMVTGGESEPNTESLVGLLACQGAASVLYSRFFSSASAVDPVLGSSEVSLAESQVKQAFASAARETILCVDSSKLDDRSISVSFNLRDVAMLITELDPRDSRLDAYREHVELL
ncbi:DeoR/GlpR transcriptional regulator [Salinibacterium sp. NSLL150]|uniref:DeoR/GlpR family DNA-binding transcription regulator n=1 Tax=unclassified Salinibacterium TaxID=2632331 RepID=UPI0018CDBE4F|nr:MULTISPECIES: DeoR/GlpR family DNA-binding transcription regulator [unclassified Salinibacterium]MBH0097597.1 DeoR/GlpR transcriptional regulator [Salinibacterium sp. NSLL35]MBH0100352.1 DeoR/GlpR transcriptional regulator [Salinibacterium sp. NSLL150]MBH0103111.1 DeoR/GlpR transcriptional regulator [Salinibacterium sp. NSLL16]MBH0105872.1 DeoR/GlpR transcriptional regulator [Salinibacterium sp. NSLL17]MBH0110354.1 DeoR/GlpR transcriptional regulator [Salinibacterium sp. NG22]